MKHSADVAQSWIGPMGVDGHGPAWQFAVIVIAPQQTWPLAQTAALVHARPPVVPPLDDPLLLDTPPPDPLLLDALPLDEPPLLDDEPVPPASVEPPLLVPLWSGPLDAKGLPNTSSALRSPQPRANGRSATGSSLPKFITLLGPPCSEA
jgi:hypothetical protein